MWRRWTSVAIHTRFGEWALAGPDDVPGSHRYSSERLALLHGLPTPWGYVAQILLWPLLHGLRHDDDLMARGP